MIYFLRNKETERIKIGYVRGRDRVELRLCEFQTGNDCEIEILGTMEGSTLDERNLHGQFEFAHVRGEWYSPHPLLMGFIGDNSLPFMARSKRQRNHIRRKDIEREKERDRKLMKEEHDNPYTYWGFQVALGKAIRAAPKGQSSEETIQRLYDALGLREDGSRIVLEFS